MSGDIIEINAYDTGRFSTNFGSGIAIVIKKMCFFYFDYQYNKMIFGGNDLHTCSIPFNLL